MREIEIKARVNDLEELTRKLKKLNIALSKPRKQHDVVFSLPGASDNAFNANWLRIRTEDDQKVTFNLKRSVVGHLDSIEHETVVEDSGELESIIRLLGYQLYSDLTKVRRTATVNNIEICIDHVPELGDFIEAERIMEHDAEHDAVIAELWELLEQLGVSKADEVHVGYDVLERRKRGVSK